jgi:uncharacterized protein (UPF0303 family)
MEEKEGEGTKYVGENRGNRINAALWQAQLFFFLIFPRHCSENTQFIKNKYQVCR